MQEYYVKSGDTMWKIANRLGIPLSSMIAANPHIADPNVLNIGDVLYLPTGTPMGATMMGAAPTGGYAGPTWQYTVKSGDSLWKLSKRYRVPHADLIAANPHLSDPNMIMPGQVINVPGRRPGVTKKPAPSKPYYAPPAYQAPSAAYPPPPQPLINISPPTQINADLNINQINPPVYEAPKYYEPKPFEPMPPKMPKPAHYHHHHQPSVAKLYIQEEVTELVKKKKPPGYVTFCYDPTLPPGVIIQGPPLGDVTNPFVPPSHIGGYKPFYEYGTESSSGWKMESKWFKESSS